jgi:hypothetical protein
LCGQFNEPLTDLTALAAHGELEGVTPVVQQFRTGVIKDVDMNPVSAGEQWRV